MPKKEKVNVQKELGQFIDYKKPQQIYPDSKYSPLAWDVTRAIRVYVHLIDSHTFEEITGQKLATVRRPILKARYNFESIPWSSDYSEGLPEELDEKSHLSTIDDESYNGRHFVF